MRTIGPVLIVGYPRSGTTAVAYPLIRRSVMTNELQLFETIDLSDQERSTNICDRLCLVYPVIDRSEIDQLKKKLDGLNYTGQFEELYRWLGQMKAGKIDLFSYELRDSSKETKTEVIDTMRGSISQMVWGDKHPRLIFDPRLERILKSWPADSRLIYVQRDGRDVVASHLRLGWIDQSLIAQLFEEWAESYRRLKGLSRVLLVRQEQLIDNPESVVKDMNRFLGTCVLGPYDYDHYVYKHDPVEGHRIHSLADRRRHQGYWSQFFAPHVIPAGARAVLQELGYT